MQKLLTKLSTNVLLGFAVLLIFSAFVFGTLVSSASAQVPPEYVPCGGIADEEYHSLRPYQASPCNQEATETALFCGNQLVLQDTVSATEGACSLRSDGKYDCTVTKTKEIAINLSGAELPILGNTDDVVSSQSQQRGLDSAGKTTEYASWYLSGVSNKAELPAYDLESLEDQSDLVNFSGPLNKLLPKELQKQERIATINQAGGERHNQVIGCVYNLLAGIRVGEIVECYPSAANKSVVRLSDLANHIPPQEKDIGTEYKDFKDYWIAYKRWQGESCLRLPILDVTLCVDNPLKPNAWGNLWANVPFASTEDRKGLVETDTLGVQPASEGVEISGVSFTNQTPAELFFAHTEEVAELTSLLQKTYIPEGESETGGVSGVSPSDFGSCDLTNIRTNPGDDLFAGEISGDLTYTAKFTCEAESSSCYQNCLKNYPPNRCSGLPVCGGSGTTVSPSCSKKVNVALSLETETPKADEIWERTVAGTTSVFKRIFPKIGLGGPILGLLDIPAATKVNYTSADGTPVVAGNPGNQRSGESAELYFPHFGGVQEYFLKGIQTALRPKGFGETIASGELGAATTNANCDENAPEISLDNLISKENFYQLAVNWVPGGEEGTQALQCYNDAVGRAENKGINAAILLWVWLNESGASNYNVASNVLDFGSVAAPPENFNAQIESFISTAKAYGDASSNPNCSGRSVSDLEAFAYLFATGTCDPGARVEGTNETARQYYEKLVRGIGIVSSCTTPSSTTDTSCP